MKIEPENRIAREIVDAAIKIHRILGPGLLESVYEAVLAQELNKRGFPTLRQVPIPIEFEDLYFDEGFRADLLVCDLVIVELKSAERVHPINKKQTLTYLKLGKKRLGLLINFGEYLVKDGITPSSTDSPIRADPFPFLLS